MQNDKETQGREEEVFLFIIGEEHPKSGSSAALAAVISQPARIRFCRFCWLLQQPTTQSISQLTQFRGENI